MRQRVFLALGISVILTSSAISQEAKRPAWDQKQAVEKVKSILATEEKGELPWDKIAWKTDAAEAAALAGKDQKPIFVFLYLKKAIGPANAPC